jgi:hypothetical protein
MRRIRFAVLSLIVAVFLAIAAATKASAGEIDKLEARFEIYGFAGFHVLTNRTTIEESTGRYAIAMDLDTRGLASVFVELTSHSAVSGAFVGEAYRPQAYRADVRRNGVDRHYGVDYRGDGTVINVSAPPAGQPLLIGAQQMRGLSTNFPLISFLSTSSPVAAFARSSFRYSMAAGSTIFASKM